MANRLTSALTQADAHAPAWRRWTSGALARAKPKTPQRAMLAMFTIAVGFFIAGKTIGPYAGALGSIVVLAGMTSCGWSWLLARTLFHNTPFANPWPLIVVGALTVSGAGLLALEALAPSAAAHPVSRMATNVHMLTSSAVLLLALVEAFDRFGHQTAAAERRFRVAFASGYAVLLVVSVLWLSGSAEGSAAHRWADAVRIICAILAVVGGVLAVRFRETHPLADLARRPKAPRAATPEDEALATRLKSLLVDEEPYTASNFSVATLSQRLREPEYKVTRAITGPLGFANFNRLANHFRIERAKQLLRDPSTRDQTILAIALDSGFGSIGPFNRAFKSAVGVTPSTYRAAPSI